MRITVRFFAQVRAAAGEGRRELELPDRARVGDAVRRLAEGGPPDLSRLLLDDRGDVNPTLMVFIGEDPVSPDDDRPMRDGETLDIMSPISGG